MQTTLKKLSDTKVELTIVADDVILSDVKRAVLERMSHNVKVPGFREGKAPANLIEKQLDQNLFQAEFLEQAVNTLYVKAINDEKIRPVASPKIDLIKFVPFATLEFTATTEIIGTIKLPDYTKIKVAKKTEAITAKDVDNIIENIRTRGAEKKDVERAAKDGDQTVIDFKGVDAKTKESIAGADGKDYPLILGSKSFIPGFEEELIGLAPGEEKTFDIVFPKDYGAAALQSKKVTFTVTLNKVQEMVLPKVDDAFAASVGPFKTVAELKADIKKQLIAERAQQEQRAYENAVLEAIAAKTVMDIPKALVEEEIDRMEEEEKRNVVYRGQTWQEHLAEEGLDETAHREKQRANAEIRVKAGLVLGEIAEKENMDVTKEELDLRIQLLKGQYPDPAMQSELDKPDNRREVASRLLSEKTIARMTELASK